jgi:hypothetical protein
VLETINLFHTQFKYFYLIKYRATAVNQKYSQLRTTFHLQMLSKMSPTRDLTNGRSLEHNPYLRDIEQHISWCQQRLVSIEWEFN